MSKKYIGDELAETLNCRYKGNSFKSKNPKSIYRKTNLHDGVNQDGFIFQNGKRRLYVRTFDSELNDRFVKKTGIHRDYQGNFIMNVKNRDVKDYDLLVSKIDKAMKFK